MVIDDARMVDAKACQIETWVKKVPGDAEFWALPACNPFGFFELTLGAAYASDANLAPGQRSTNPAVQFKSVIRPLEVNGYGWGVVLGNLSRPGVDQQRNLVGDVYGYLIGTRSLLDDRLVVHANLGFVNRHIENARSTTLGVGIEWIALPQFRNLQWLAEIYGDSSGSRYTQVGLRWWVIPDRWQIDATYGNNLNRFDDGNRWLTLGVRLLSPPFLP